ncbi:MAG: hypothetical protein L7V88_06780 [Alphaproteobacteria bacterium]|nr:hypothetical protein [Alphaproteobacteria bacterium]
MAQLSRYKKTNDFDRVDAVSLADLRNKFGGSLKQYLTQNKLSDVIILFPADIDVKDHGKICFFSVMAVTTNFIMPEMIEPFARSLANKNQELLFSWVPAHLFGSDEFSIYIESSEFGELLVNGIVGEIIREANIEEAVEYLANKTST